MKIESATLIDKQTNRRYDVLALTELYRRRDLLVGRDHDECDIPLGNGLSPTEQGDSGLAKVSRKHAVVRYDVRQRAVYLMDKGSSNGTTLNGILLEEDEESLLKHGDEIGLGSAITEEAYILIYEEVREEEPTEPKSIY